MTRTIVAYVILLLGAASLIGCGDTRTPDEKIAAANESIQISRFRDAIIEMRNLLRDRPDLVPARLTLGRALLAVGDMSAAEKELERARQMGAVPDDYLEPLVRAWQARGNHHEVLADADPAQLRDAQTREVVRALRGRSMLALDSLPAATGVFRKVLADRVSPEAQRIALIGEAELAGRRGDSATAVTRLKEAMELVPESPETILALGRTYLTRSEFDNAIKLLEVTRDSQMQARRQDWFFIEAQLAEAFLGKGELDSARAATETLLQIGKTHPMSAYLHGRVELDSGNVNEAIQYFQQVIADYPSYAPALTLLGVALLELDDMDQAEMHLSEAVAAAPDNVKTRRLLAETRMRMGRSRAAIATLQAGLRNDSADASMITLLGRESLRIGNRSDGLRYLREALAEDPDNLRANLALAQAYLSDGETDAAVAVLNALPPSAIAADRRALLVRIAQIDRSDPDTAARQIDTLLEEAPGDPFLLGLAGGFYLTLNQLDTARALFEQVLTAMPDNRSAMLSLLEVDERSGDFARSRALFTAANEAAPEDLLPLLVLARIDSASGNEAAALARVREALDKHPTALLPNLILGAEAMRSGDLDQAELLAGVAVERYPKAARAHALMGLIKMRQNRYDEASARFRRAVLSEPGDAEYRYYLGQADLANERVRQARTSFKDALSRNENHLGSLRALATLDARDGKNGLANQRVAQIRQVYGFSWPATVAVADVRAVQGDTDEAIALYEQAQTERITWPISLELFRLRRASEREAPEQSLERWLQTAPEHVPGLLALAQHRQRAGDAPAAIDLYERARRIDRENTLAANNVAWLYLERGGEGDTVLALDAARVAYNRAPGNTSIADTYGWMLYHNDERDIARDVFESAMTSTSAQESPDMAYHFAATLHADGRLVQAREILDEALRTEEPFASRGDAQALRNQL